MRLKLFFIFRLFSFLFLFFFSFSFHLFFTILIVLLNTLHKKKKEMRNEKKNFPLFFSFSSFLLFSFLFFCFLYLGRRPLLDQKLHSTALHWAELQDRPTPFLFSFALLLLSLAIIEVLEELGQRRFVLMKAGGLPVSTGVLIRCRGNKGGSFDWR